MNRLVGDFRWLDWIHEWAGYSKPKIYGRMNMFRSSELDLERYAAAEFTPVFLEKKHFVQTSRFLEDLIGRFLGGVPFIINYDFYTRVYRIPD